MKTFKFMAMLLMAMLVCANFSACSDDDENGSGSGGLTGYWVISGWESDMAQWIVEGYVGSDADDLCGSLSYHFINSNTVEIGLFSIYAKPKSNCLLQKVISGKTFYCRFEDANTNTYVRKDNKIYINNGDILTISGSTLRVDGHSSTWVKVK